MVSVRICSTIAWLFVTFSSTLAQTIRPSNASSDLYPVSTSPRFLLNGTEFSELPAIQLAPLGPYAQIDHSTFMTLNVPGHLVNVNAGNANAGQNGDQFSYISCDPSSYSGNLGASDVFRIAVNAPQTNIIILYSETDDHCVATGLNDMPTIGGILTTTNSMVASKLASLGLNQGSPGTAHIVPDLNSYMNSSSGHGWGNNNGVLGQSPTTAVAMIILYSITGIITALFVVIIITGAVRAHRHPERYGPRNIVGRGRQSRAKGIARAMLETLPIVKFGDHENIPKKNPDGTDIEMNAAAATPGTEGSAGLHAENPDKAVSSAGATEASTENRETTEAMGAVRGPNNADGRDEEGHLGCSICTEDFTKGEEVRVLPCNHKFHPECVDPWLLNVSGTCPLCRIDLRPQGEAAQGDDGRSASSATATESGAGTLTMNDDQGESRRLPPPLGSGAGTGGGRRETIASLRHIAAGSREERIAALRRFRQERGRNHSTAAGGSAGQEEERRGLARRFRERFRIRTVRGNVEDGQAQGPLRQTSWAPDTRTS